MNITAPAGTKVTVTSVSIKAGYPLDALTAAKFLRIGGVYTLAKTEAHSWNTDVWVDEVPNITFNSCCFADIPAEG